MSSVNKAIVMGYLGAAPETRYSPAGDQITTFRIATTERWKPKDGGEPQERTEWHRCVAFGKVAAIASEHLEKGQLCYAEGRIQTRKWQDKDGADHYTTEIIVDQLRFFRKAGEEPATPARPAAEQRPKGPPARATAPAQQRPTAKPGTPFGDMPDDIPF